MGLPLPSGLGIAEIAVDVDHNRALRSRPRLGAVGAELLGDGQVDARVTGGHGLFFGESGA